MTMTMTGQLQLGAVQVVSPANGELLGYAFTVESAGGQLQRWLLFRNPDNALDIQPPPASMAGWTLQDWQSNVPTLWRPGSFYIWAQSTVHGATWTQIPDAANLPPPVYPDVEGADLQLDPDAGKVLNVEQLFGNELLQGRAFTVGGVEQASSVEYWMLPATYQPAGGTRTAKVAVGQENASSLQDFVDVANQIWGPGSALVITGCVNYNGDQVPHAP